MSKETPMFEQKIANFVAWCGSNELPLPVPSAAIDANPEPATSENRKRTGAKEFAYPPQYYAGQYTELWRVPSAADAVFYMTTGKGKKK